MMGETCQVKVRIKGRVQRVWFRGWTEREACSLGLDGWVRNCADGTVEAVFSGPERQVRQMIERCWKGPPHANVIAVEEAPFEGEIEPDFRQIR